ncbi:MAG: LptF/LptG family permease [Rickettsiales bacterium]|jgi:lipopolysaccharide export system permease protein|nr:LptF/LptG family permease [Rickettsiales bacterium]
MPIMTRFLALRFAKSLGLVVLIVSGIIFATSFMQDIAGAPSVPAALSLSLSHFFELFPMFLPLAAFIGTLLAFYRLLVSSELVIVQSAGWSAYKIMRPMLWVSLSFGMLAAMVINPIGANYDLESKINSKIEKIDDAVWLREKTGDGAIIIRSVNLNSAGDGLDFVDAAILRQNAAFQIEERVDAKVLSLRGGRLSAKGAAILSKDGALRTADWSADTTLTGENVMKRYLKTNQVSFWELPGFIAALRGMGAGTDAHLMQFLSLLFLPLVMVSMCVMGALFSQTRERRNFSFAKKFGFGILACFVVYFVIQIFSAMGSSGAMPPLVAALAPPAIVLFLSASGIIRAENK